MNIKVKKLALAGTIATTTLFTSGIVASAESYTVKAGDTLSEIAESKKTTVERLVELNKISNPDFIMTGQVLELGDLKDVAKQTTSAPVASSATPAVPAPAPVAPVAPAAPVATETPAATATTDYSGYSSNVVLANGNTPGAVGSYAAARMAEMTGVSASTWENIIARESNGQVDAYNPSGASGLFQTMPGWGSTATVEDQIQAAYRAYSAQGLSAWAY
ncbi:LysM peptidoglycan-binding domain-containing protein [Streptococcus cristatus]|uniref:LysM peptidoglycan-binding domain-containing protein n=1 Tax=Streptococcus cristatus TaxID=45634 RepID=UPI000F668EBD|nr:LysM peptidoglycan-binding domain-containing protein [Streptococcus cristatus]MBZ2152344.1 LysM peptidoglycan-binding domain-containing protein [Streptococcus cristatus]RSJ75422.1 putative transglycosylase IsaA precursor [Streptococcus cristatus]